jgi:hypothetical protein
MNPTSKLAQAVSAGDLVAAQGALQDGADANKLEGPDDGSILNAAVRWTQDPAVRLAMAGLLLESGADPNLPQNENMAPLASALLHMDTELVRLLLDHGADPNLVVDGPESTFDWASFDYRFYVWDLQIPDGFPWGDDTTEEEFLEFLDRKALEHGKLRPTHLLLMRQRGARTLEEIEMGRMLEAVQGALSCLCMSFEPVLQKRDHALLVADLGNTALAIHLTITRQKQDNPGFSPIPGFVQEACDARGIHPFQIRANLTYGQGTTGFVLHGCRDLIRHIQMDRSRWQSHLLGGIRMKEWAARLGKVSALQVDAHGGRLELRVDGGPVLLPIGKDEALDGPPVDPLDLCRSTTTDGEYWIFTCECGVPGCNGIYPGIQVIHQGGLTLWRTAECPGLPLAIFHRWQYRRTILRGIRALLAHQGRGHSFRPGLGQEVSQWRKAFNKAKAGIPSFSNPYLDHGTFVDY